MTDGPSYGFDTLQIHAGARPDPATGARQTPIYQTTAYVFRDAEHAAALFNLQEVGFIYSRLTNPTVAVLQERIATLEGGVGAVCCSSGHCGSDHGAFPADGSGQERGGLHAALMAARSRSSARPSKRFGWSAKFVDFDDLDAVRSAIDEDTRAVFCEAIANPGRLHHRRAGHCPPSPMTRGPSADRGQYFRQPPTCAARSSLCATLLVVHSTTKYLDRGNGTVTGGCVVDSGKFDWSASDKFPSL